MLVPAEPVCPGGPRLSRLVMGAWRLADWGLGRQNVVSWIETCLDLGITTFDHADIYGNGACEVLFGEALRLRPELRKRMQLVSKCGIRLSAPDNPVKHYDTGPGHVVASVERSLRALGTDCLDALLIHRPDPLMNADETAGALNALVRDGKVLSVGVSNFTPSQYALLESRLDAPLVTNQVELSVLHLDPFLDGTLDHLQRRGVAPMAWSSLAGGRLFTGGDARTVRTRAALDRVAGELGGAGPDQVALAWLLRHPARIFPVIGSGNPERIQRATGALDLALDRRQWFAIREASAGTEVP